MVARMARRAALASVLLAVAGCEESGMDPALVDPAPLALFECGRLSEADALALARPIASDAGLSLLADDGVAGEGSYTLQFVDGDANIFISKADTWDGPQLGAFPTERSDRRVLATLDRLADALDCRPRSLN